MESLNAELAELGSSDALTRAKQQHESIVTSMRQRFDADVLAANEKIDLLTKTLTEKVNLVHERYFCKCFDAVGWATGRSSGL